MVAGTAPGARVVRFGPFELDLRSGELRGDGRVLTLQDQPLRLLTVLLERPGELVTRDELRHRLWPADTFVDFEHGLNAAVKRLRDALGESADAPRFVETVPRRGYRLIRAEHAAGDVAAIDREPAPASPHGRRILVWIAVGGALCVVAALAAASLKHERAPRIMGYRSLARDELRLFPPELSPLPLMTDGSRVYFPEWQNGVLRPRQVPVAGGETVPVDAFQGYAGQLILEALSPDGSHFLMATMRSADELWELPFWIVPVVGGAPRRLGEVAGHVAAWARDGRIAYAHGNDVYVTDSRGHAPRRLVSAGGRPYWLRWSPDGARLRMSVGDLQTLRFSLWELVIGGPFRQLMAGWIVRPMNAAENGRPTGATSSSRPRARAQRTCGRSASAARRVVPLS